MAATDTTTNFKFNLTDFDKIPWHTELHNNFHIMDALMARFLAISLVPTLINCLGLLHCVCFQLIQFPRVSIAPFGTYFLKWHNSSFFRLTL